MELLSADEFPRSVVMSNYNIPIDYLELEIEVASLRTGEPFSWGGGGEGGRGGGCNSNNETAWLFLSISFT